jgi:hypothetical protein
VIHQSTISFSERIEKIFGRKEEEEEEEEEEEDSPIISLQFNISPDDVELHNMNATSIHGSSEISLRKMIWRIEWIRSLNS